MLNWQQFFDSTRDALLVRYRAHVAEVTIQGAMGNFNAKQMSVLRRNMAVLQEIPIRELRNRLAASVPFVVGLFSPEQGEAVLQELIDVQIIAVCTMKTVETFAPFDRKLNMQIIMVDKPITEAMVSQMLLCGVDIIDGIFEPSSG